MNLSPQFGSRFYVTAKNRRPSDLEDRVSTLPGYQELSVASGIFGPQPNSPIAFSVPDEQDQAADTLLKQEGYRFERLGNFMHGQGCLAMGALEARFYKPETEA